jgi:hypothetical protein
LLGGIDENHQKRDKKKEGKRRRKNNLGYISECVFVVLVIQYTMPSQIAICEQSGDTIFPQYLIKDTIFKRKILNTKYEI